MPRCLTVVLVAVLALAVRADARADGSWLDAPLAAWNEAGAPVPAPSPDDPTFVDPLCQRQLREPEFIEEALAAKAGWRLTRPSDADGGIVVVYGQTGFDGMCRSYGFNAFVFVDGTFAGTLSPVSMFARVDGSLRDVEIGGEYEVLVAQFNRYTDRDPLCCPSAVTTVTYIIDYTPMGPVLLPVDSDTEPNSP